MTDYEKYLTALVRLGEKHGKVLSEKELERGLATYLTFGNKTFDDLAMRHDMEKKILVKTTLDECGGNRSKAAKELGVHRSALDRYIK